MKRLECHIRVVCAALALAVLATLAGCSEWSPFRPPTPPDLFVIRIDSLRYSPVPAAGDTLLVGFWGYIGPNTCYEFFGFYVHRDSFALDMTVHGIRHHASPACGPTLQYLDWEEMEVFPLYEGDLILVVHQPDETTLVDTVHVAARALGGARPN